MLVPIAPRNPVYLDELSKDNISFVLSEGDPAVKSIIDYFLRTLHTPNLMITLKLLNSMNIRGAQLYWWYRYMHEIYLHDNGSALDVVNDFPTFSRAKMKDVVQYINKCAGDDFPHKARPHLTAVS